MRSESHVIKMVVCVDMTMRPDCLNRVMAALDRFRAKLAGTPTLHRCVKLALLSFNRGDRDPGSYDIRFVPLEQPLPGCGVERQPCAAPEVCAGSWRANEIILKAYLQAFDIVQPNVWQDERPVDPREATHTIIVLLTHRVRPADRTTSLSAQEQLARTWISRPEKGEVTLIPFCVDSPVQQYVLAGMGAEGFPTVCVPSSRLDDCFDRLRLLLLRILSYAPGRAPAVEDVPAQFLPDYLLSYPAASPLEFDPVILGWDEVKGLRES